MAKRKRPTQKPRRRPPKGTAAARPAGTAGSKAARAAGGRAGQRYWIYGAHPVLAALANPERTVRRLLITAEAARRLEPGPPGKSPPEPRPEIVERATIERLLPAGAVHQGLAAEVEPLDQPDLAEICIVALGTPVVVLDQVTDPQNVGAVFRAAAAFGARAVVMTDRHAPPEGGALAKAAAGALELVPLVRVTNLARALDALKEAGYWCLGLDGAAPEPIASVPRDRPFAVVLGSEGEGMRRLTAERCDMLARIPISPRIESLNVAAAAAITLYELTRNG